MKTGLPRLFEMRGFYQKANNIHHWNLKERFIRAVLNIYFVSILITRGHGKRWFVYPRVSIFLTLCRTYFAFVFNWLCVLNYISINQSIMLNSRNFTNLVRKLEHVSGWSSVAGGLQVSTLRSETGTSKSSYWARLPLGCTSRRVRWAAQGKAMSSRSYAGWNGLQANRNISTPED